MKLYIKLISAIFSLFYLAGTAEMIYSLAKYGFARNFAMFFLIPFIPCTIVYTLLFLLRKISKPIVLIAVFCSFASYLFPTVILGSLDATLLIFNAPLLIPAVLLSLFILKNTTTTPCEQTEFVEIQRFERNGENYKIITPKRIANRHSIIHCIDDYIAWEQAPLFPRLVGRSYGIKTPIYKFEKSKSETVIFVIKGKPNGITGLDDGIFRSASKFDKDYINVMTLRRFKSGEF